MLKGTSKLIKKINIYNVINILKNEPGLSRAEIADMTKLTRASITKITKELIDNGILIEEGNNENTGGRPSIMLYINKDAGYFVGLYLAPKKIISIFTNYIGEKIAFLETEIFDFSKENILKIVDNHIAEYKKINNNILGIGIALNGIVNSNKGISIFSPHYKWKNFDLKTYMKSTYNCPIVVENDVRLMALGELEYGGAQGESNFVLVNIGDGVGSGIIIDKKIYSGNNYCAGEIGHTKVSKKSQIICSCGKKGCLETFLARENMLKTGKEFYDLSVENVEELLREFEAKNPKAIEFVEVLCEKLAFSLGSIVNLLNPHTILINGEINIFGKKLYTLIEKNILENSLDVSLEKLKVKPTKLGDYSACKGAISVLFENLYK